MDGNRFDALTRSLAECPSRRRVLGAILGAVTASLASAAGRGADAAPRCKRIDQACQTTADCCPGPNANGDVQCAPNGKKSKTCQACAAGTHACNGTCVPFTTNANCGGCGASCRGGSSCVAGVCTCPSGQTLCNGACVATLTDRDNCGGCGKVCAAGEACCGGVCRNDVGAACATAADCCDSTCSTTNTGDQICCQSGKACYTGSGDDSVCCATAGAVCYFPGCCESGKVCGDSISAVCCTATETCVDDACVPSA